MGETSLSKFCFDVLHVKNNNETHEEIVKTKNAKTIKKSLIEKIYYLNSNIVEINNKDQLLSFARNNKDFCIDPNGFDFLYGLTIKKYNKDQESYTGWIYPEIQTLANTYIVLKNFINSEFENLIVFEDHISITKNFCDLFIKYFEFLPKNFDLFFQDSKFDSLYKPKQMNSLISKYYSSASESNSCYIISKKAAIKALLFFQSEPGINLPSTWFYTKTKIFECYSPNPRLETGCIHSNINFLNGWDVKKRYPIDFLEIKDKQV
jgi:hypothetical protein